MKLSSGLEWAVHCCVVLSVAGEPVPAATLAEIHDVSTTYLAKHLQALSRVGIVRSTQGRSGGYLLTRAPKDITLLDIVEAVEGPAVAFVCTEIRQRGPLAAPPDACKALCGINRAMIAADHAWRESLRSVTVADLAEGVQRQYSGDVMGMIASWLAERVPTEV